MSMNVEGSTIDEVSFLSGSQDLGGPGFQARGSMFVFESVILNLSSLLKITAPYKISLKIFFIWFYLTDFTYNLVYLFKNFS